MIIIKNNIIPAKGYKAVTIWPFVFVRKELSDEDINHEKIHIRQQLEMLIVPFYIFYLVFALVNGYSKNPFEKEAHLNQSDINYLKKRKFYNWVNYI